MWLGVARFLLTLPLISFFRSGAITGYQRRSELQSGCQQQLSKSLSFFFFFLRLRSSILGTVPLRRRRIGPWDVETSFFN